MLGAWRFEQAGNSEISLGFDGNRVNLLKFGTTGEIVR